MNLKAEWKNRLLTLPDPVFFNLVRNYLGNMKTPFNKHRIIEKLCAYLGKEETRILTAQSLDEMDKKILTVIFLLNGAPEAPIIDLMQNLWTSWEIRQRLINLQERLILFKDKHGLYFPVPGIGEYLRERTITPAELIPETPRQPGTDPLPWLSDAFLTAFFSYLIHYPVTLKANGSITRKSLNDMFSIFPIFDRSQDIPVSILKFFRLNGLVSENNDKQLKPDPMKLAELAESKKTFRLTILWADFLTIPDGLTFPWKREDGEKIITGMIRSLPSDSLYTSEVMLRIMGLLLTERRPPRADLVIILERLITLGFLIKENDGLGLCRKLKETPAGSPKEETIALHPNHEMLLMPETDMKTVYPLVWYTRIMKFDQIGTYSLDQESFFMGLNRGKELPPFREVYSSLTTKEIPQNIQFSLDSWLDQFRSVRLIDGIILKVNTSRIPLIEKNPLLRPYIHEILAPGIYLMDPGEKDLWENTLLNTGITAMPPVEKVSAPVQNIRSLERGVKIGPELKLKDKRKPSITGELNLDETRNRMTENGQKDRTEQLLISLKKLDIPEAEKEELEERIRKKIILKPVQLKEGIVEKDIREAKGLDYNGKIRLIEASLSSGKEYLEISWFTPDDDLQTDRIIPRHLAKEGENLILSGPYLEDPGGSSFRIRVRKISNLKRKKISFFGL